MKKSISLQELGIKTCQQFQLSWLAVLYINSGVAGLQMFASVYLSSSYAAYKPPVGINTQHDIAGPGAYGASTVSSEFWH